MATPGRKPKVTPSDVFDLFARREDRAEPLTAPEVADEFAVSRPVATDKLATLAEQGEVVSKKVGGRARVYWVPMKEDAQTPLTAFERPEDTDAVLRQVSNELGEPITVGETVYEDGDSHPLDAPESGPDHGEDSIPVESPGDTDGGVSAERAPESVTGVLGRGDLGPDQQDAVRAMYEYLREYGTARKGDFTEAVYPEHPAGYDSPDGWWNRLGTGSTGPDDGTALADLPGVEKPPAGRPVWHYSEESSDL